MSAAPAVGAVGAPRPLHRHPAFLGTLAAGALAAAGLAAAWSGIAAHLAAVELWLGRAVPLEALGARAGLLLPLLGFAAGLLASVSPCILPLVPLNLAAIGAAEASGARAASLSGRFVLGAALALTALGLAGDLAGWLLVEQRGPVLLGAGAVLVYLGLASVELAPLPLAGRAPGAGRKLGPTLAGAAFALVTTPCASPLLAGLLAAAAASATPGLGAATLGAFALGYTALVFAAGAFGGGLVARLRGLSTDAPRAAAAAVLLVAGAGFGLAGVRWFL